MNKRQRKKWLKKHNLYINPRDTWELYGTIAEFILPRLKMFRKESITYPGRGEMDTYEKWCEALDKMILAFEYIVEEDKLDEKPEYNYLSEMEFKMVNVSSDDGLRHTRLESNITPKGEELRTAYYAEVERRDKIIKEGLDLFSKYFRDLWW